MSEAKSLADLFSNWDPEALKLLEDAKKVSATFGDTYIGSEHLLLAMSERIDRLLDGRSLHAAWEAMRDKEFAALTPGCQTPRYKTAIQRAALAARTKSRQVEIDDLLHAMLADKESNAWKLLHQVGLDPDLLLAAGVFGKLMSSTGAMRHPGQARGHMAESLEIRITPDRGRGLFARRPFAAGDRIVEMKGWLATSAELHDDWLAMQVGPDLWLCSHGDLDDDCGNHSCDPNTGFTTGRPILFALRDIAAGEEICWDYSTSIAEPGWSLECRCGAPKCRGIIRAWPELTAGERDRLRPTALAYLR